MKMVITVSFYEMVMARPAKLRLDDDPIQGATSSSAKQSTVDHGPYAALLSMVAVSSSRHRRRKRKDGPGANVNGRERYFFLKLKSLF